MNVSEAYSFLGIRPPSTEDAINKAYKTAAKKYHPDMQGGDAAKFRKATEAKELLLKNIKYGIPNTQNVRYSSQNPPVDINDLFNSIFNQHRQQYQRTARPQPTPEDIMREYVRKEKERLAKERLTKLEKEEKLFYRRSFIFRTWLLGFWGVKELVCYYGKIDNPMANTVIFVCGAVIFYNSRNIVRFYTALKELFS